MLGFGDWLGFSFKVWVSKKLFLGLGTHHYSVHIANLIFNRYQVQNLMDESSVGQKKLMWHVNGWSVRKVTDVQKIKVQGEQMHRT